MGYTGRFNKPAGADLSKRGESYEDFLLRTSGNSEYERRVKSKILAKKKKRGY